MLEYRLKRGVDVVAVISVTIAVTMFMVWLGWRSVPPYVGFVLEPRIMWDWSKPVDQREYPHAGIRLDNGWGSGSWVVTWSKDGREILVLSTTDLRRLDPREVAKVCKQRGLVLPAMVAEELARLDAESEPGRPWLAPEKGP